MKIKHLLIGMLAIAGAVACKQDEPVAEPVLEVNKTNVAVAATAGESAFEVTANNAWSAAADAEWVSLDPANGTGGEKAVTVKVTAEDNTAAEVRTATVTVKSGELTKTLKVTQAAAEAEEPGPGEEPTPEGVAWGMMGCFVDNLWANDVPMTKEGEWIVAKDAQFTELTFKIRGNQSWADETNIGVAPGSERGVVNGRVAVVTAEYAKANLGGDAADIKLNGDAGTYDVYFSVENMEVYVMEQGYKPGEKEPQNPEPVEITYTVVGTIDGYAWSNNAAVGLMAVEGNYHVVKNVPFVWNSTLCGGDYNRIEFKIVETGTWSGYAYPETNVDQYANAEFTVGHGGENIAVDAPVGNYDVYFDKANLKVWVMEAGFKPGEKEPLVPQPEPEYELAGKQWYYSNMGVLVDLGLYEEDVMVVAVPLMDGSGFGAYMYGPYEIEKTDATSGKIIFTQYDPEWDEFMDPVEYPYSELSENFVMIGAEPLTGDPTPLPFVALDEPFEIQFEEIGGGADPVGPIENGQYWFFNGTKVMAPLAEGVTTGVLPAGNVIDGASTEKNIFTLMYDPDWSYYTIMDSYGRFLGQTDETGNITVTDVLPTDDTYAFYLWCVEPGYGEATSIYNAAYYYDITYSAADNKWVLVDGGYEYPETLPTLVKAENPVEEPTGPQAITVAEFLTLPVGTTEYELTGVIEGTYNTTYGNFYLNDGTDRILVYGLTATKQTYNDKSFASLGLRDGDTLTLIGQRADYNGTAQVGGPAYYVSHVAAPYVDFAVGSATVDAEVTTYTIEFESNVAWTATASEGVTVSPASGEGNGSVVMTFAANTSNDPVDYTVTFTAGELTKTFTLTQKGVPAEGAEPKYVKVTEEQADWSGKYLIVFGSNAHATLSGKDLISTKAVNVVAGEIEATSDLDAAVMTVSKNGDKYVMTYPDGKYFSMAKNSSSSSTSAFDLTFAYTANGVKISGVASGTTYILYHNSNNGNFYRCYVDKNGQSGYTLPTLYKYTE